MSPVRVRENASLRRQRKNPREPYDVVLIVCEGSKTEPAYFTALKNELRLSSANISIFGKECGSADYLFTKNKGNPLKCLFIRIRRMQAKTEDISRLQMGQILIYNGANPTFLPKLMSGEVRVKLPLTPSLKKRGGTDASQLGRQKKSE